MDRRGGQRQRFVGERVGGTAAVVVDPASLEETTHASHDRREDARHLFVGRRRRRQEVQRPVLGLREYAVMDESVASRARFCAVFRPSAFPVGTRLLDTAQRFRNRSVGQAASSSWSSGIRQSVTSLIAYIERPGLNYAQQRHSCRSRLRERSHTTTGGGQLGDNFKRPERL